MRKHAFVLTAGAVALALGIWFLARPGSAADEKGDVWKPTLPEADFAKLVEDNNKIIAESLKDKPTKATTRRARVAALMIAAFAQTAKGGDPAKLATLRDNAVKVAKALEDKKYDEAKNLTAGLNPMAAAAPGAKPGPVNVVEGVDLEDIMHQFSTPRSKGEGYEAFLVDIDEAKKPPKESELAKLEVVAYKAAVIGKLAELLPPKKMVKNQTPKAWKDFAQTMQKEGVAVAEAAKSKDAKAAKMAVSKLVNNCNECHKLFRK